MNLRLIAVVALGVAMVAAPAAADTRSFGVDPVLLVQAAPLSLSRLPQWTDALARHESQTRRGDGAAAWQGMVARLAATDPSRLLREVNSTVNAYRYVADGDRRNAGNAADYWETPFELAASGGDCEDFAIAKYLLLRDLGVPSSQMRILVMRASGNVAEHAVLLVQTTGGAMILDNLRSAPYRYSTRTAGATVYAFNEQSMWLSLSNIVLAAR